MFGRKPTSSAAVEQIDDEQNDNELWQPSEATQRKTIDRLLLERGHITEEQLTQALGVQAQTPGKSLTQILLTMNAATEAQILSALA